MKMKVLASFAIAIVAIAAFAFTTKRVTTTQFLDESQVTSATIGSLQSDVNDPDNWATGLNYSFANGNKLAGMTFDQETASDGSGDGQLSKAEAVHALYSYYIANGLPADGSSISVSVAGSTGSTNMNITVRRKN